VPIVDAALRRAIDVAGEQTVGTSGGVYAAIRVVLVEQTTFASQAADAGFGCAFARGARRTSDPCRRRSTKSNSARA
jgi:hypothetical protein